jgi:hypothetical protein
MMEMETISETSDIDYIFTWLVAREDFITPTPARWYLDVSMWYCASEESTTRVPFQAVLDVSLFHSVQTYSGAHPASYPVRTGGKAAGA